MSKDGTQLIFSELLAEHGRIQVPLIQRDYAQGRSDQEEVRDRFLDALYEALALPVDSDELPLNLDFIYGSVKGANPSSFQPLDGQQRLTTLFLLHWYLAWLDGCSERFSELFCEDGKVSRFSYRVRSSSEEFFDKLVGFSPEQKPGEVERLGPLLQDQPWYYRHWRLDPTVQSVLVMLNTIHERFKDTHGLYARLTDKKQPAITFQLLDLDDFGLSDDLYIKMNARGKLLTPFETFKARYEQMLQDHFPDKTRLLDGQSVSISEYFARCMDTRWADFFWPFRDQYTHVFDAAVMNVFRVVILITRSTEESSFTKDVRDLRDSRQKNSYHFFHKRGWLDVPFAETLITLLDAWSGESGDFTQFLPDKRCSDEKDILEKILEEPTSLDYDDLLQLAAYVQFLRVHKGAINPTTFQEWMRVVFNLSVNTEYNRTEDFQRSLSSITELKPQMATILDHLADPETAIRSFFQLQVTEEKIKAQLLLSDDSWRPLIDRAEAHGYFRGQIGFLLKFAGVEADTADTLRFQAPFTDYLNKASVMFKDGGLDSLPDFRWERALLSYGNYMLRNSNGRNESFLVNTRSEPHSWKRLLRDSSSGSEQGRILQKLWKSLSGTSYISEQLDNIITNASGLEPWRTALIKTPAAIEYCWGKMIRRTEDRVYLLRKTQTNGAHAELFSYCFYRDVIKKKQFHVLYSKYWESKTENILPSIELDFMKQQQIFWVDYYGADKYRLYTPEENPPGILSSLLQESGFEKSGKFFQKICSIEFIENNIIELDQKLTGLDEA